MLDNFYENIKHYDQSVDKLFGKYENKTIIIVAAGPSLDKNIQLLKNLDGRAVILALGRAVKSLAQAGVKPDFIISTDAKKNIHKQFVYVEGAQEIDTIGLSTTDKNIFLKQKGRKYLALQEGLDEAEAYAREKGYDLVDTGGSVATTALDIAIKMGANPIVMVGQDLAYTDGRSHSSGTWHRQVADMPNLREVPGYYGGQVPTNLTLNIYLRWFENKIREVKKTNKEIQFIDATEGGAKIEGSEIMSLQDLIEQYL